MQLRTVRSRSLRFKVVASSLVLFAALLGLEGLAQMVGPSIPALKENHERTLLNPHPTRLWYTAPGTKEVEGAASTINALGMRGAMPIDPKPADIPRILVVGDSSLFGHGVNDPDTYPAQLQTVLQGLGHRTEVLNGSTPGYSTEQTRIFLEEVGWSLQPDLLVIGNLWSDNNFDSFRDVDLLHTQKAFSNPLASSALYRLLASAADVLRGGRGARIVTWTASDQDPTKLGRRVPLPRYAENLDAMVRDANARGIGVVFLTLTNIERVTMTLAAEEWSWEPYFKVQREVAAWHDLPNFDAQMVFVASNQKDPTDLFVDSMHPSALGHRIFAGYSAWRLVADGWPDTRRFFGKSESFPGTAVIDDGSVKEAAPFSAQSDLFRDPGGVPPPHPHEAGGRSGQGW